LIGLPGIDSSKWRTISEDLGLGLSGWFSQKRIDGVLDGLRVTCNPVGGSGYAEIVVDGQGAIPRDLSIDTETFIKTALGGQDIQTSDAIFDEKIRMHGDEAMMLAALDEDMRSLILPVVPRGGVVVKDGRITCRKERLEDVPGMIRILVKLGNHLMIREEDIPERLAKNAIKDSNPLVRLRNLELLEKRYPGWPQSVRACRAALTSTHVELKYAGAVYLGREGIGALEEMALSDTTWESHRINALKHLAKPEFREEAIPVLVQLLDSPVHTVRRAAAEGIGRLRHRDSLRKLGEILGVCDQETALVIVKAMERIREPAAEEFLFPLLQWESTPLKYAIAEALGRFGTVQAVEPLLEVAKGLTVPHELKWAARKAVAQIQSRLGGAEAGRLSITTPVEEDGGLSLAGEPEKEGGLSFEPGKDMETE
jgi:hypothetical protein